MHLIKIKDVHLTETEQTCYICIEDISSIIFNGENTIIFVKSGGTFEVKGDVSSKLAKLIIHSTDGNIVTLE